MCRVGTVGTCSRGKHRLNMLIIFMTINLKSLGKWILSGDSVSHFLSPMLFEMQFLLTDQTWPSVKPYWWQRKSGFLMFPSDNSILEDSGWVSMVILCDIAHMIIGTGNMCQAYHFPSLCPFQITLSIFFSCGELVSSLYVSFFQRCLWETELSSRKRHQLWAKQEY